LLKIRKATEMANDMTKKGKLPYRPCAGAMVVNRQGKVWAGRRIAPPGSELSTSSQLWQMPQGGIDKGEDPLDAAKRELWEETGISSVSLLGRAPDWICYDLPKELIGIGLKGKFRGQKMAWFAFRFEGEASEINITNPPSGADVEFDRWEWVDVEKLPDMIVPFKRDVYVEVVNSFRHLCVPVG
jgi:putative (di)nucleoside polyphosphate hydrolase